MTLQAFYEQLQPRLTNAQLPLDGSLGDGVFQPLLSMAEHLIVNQAQLSPIDTQNNCFDILGKLTLPALKEQELDAVLRCMEDKDGLSFLLSLEDAQTKTQPVAFSDYFGPLAASRVEEGGVYVRAESVISPLKLQNIRVSTASSIANWSLPFVLEADVVFPLEDKRWEPYAIFTGETSTISGSLGESAGYSAYEHRSFSLSIPLLTELTNFLGNGKCALELALEGSLPDPDAGVWERQSAVSLHLHMQPNGFATPVDFSVPLFQSGEYWPLRADFENGLGVSDIVNFFGSLFGAAGTAGELIPKDTPLDFFKLYSLGVGMEFGKKDGSSGSGLQDYTFSMENMQALFSISKPWELPIPNLTLGKLWVLWRITWGSLDENQKRGYLMTGQVSGELKLQLGRNALTMDVTADFPSMEIEGHLTYSEDDGSAGEAVTLSALTDGLGAKTPESWNAAGKKMGSLDLYASPKSRSFTLRGELNDLLSFDVGGMKLDLENVHAEVTFSPTKKSLGIGGVAGFEYEGEGESGFSLAMDALYDSEDGWLFWGGLENGSINLVQLVRALLKANKDAIPEEVANFELTQFDICFDGEGKQFSLMAEFDGSWTIESLGLPLEGGGSILLQKESGDTDSGSGGENALSGDTEWFAAAMMGLELGVFDVAVQINDFFNKDKLSLLFQVSYGDKYLQAAYLKKKIKEVEHRLFTLNLGGATLGDVVETVMRMINPNQKPRLDGVWSALNKIELSDFAFEFDATDKVASVLYKADLDVVGLMKIDEIGIRYTKDGKLNYVVTGDFLNKKYTSAEPLTWDAVDGKPPEVQGKKQAKFHLSYMGLGNHLEMGDVKNATGIADAVEKMKEKLRNPDMSPLTFDKSVNWLFGTDMLVCDALRIQVALLDPALYGLLITIDEKATSYLSTMRGLSLELLYKKVTEDIGMFKAVLTLPEKFRRFDIGVLTIILGTIGIEIYTNGDFLLDLGFPHNEDFSRSFSIEAEGFVGHGGILIGKLSGATCDSLPETTAGVFHSVLSLGVGLALGLGKTFSLGCVQGGATLEAFGIFEGIFAMFQPDGGGESSMYYRASAALGIVGKLFLSVDFNVISVNASADIKTFAKVTMESYQPILLDLDLSLDVKAKANVCGVQAPLSYHFRQHVRFELPDHTPGNAPWLSKKNRAALHAETLNLSNPFPTGSINSNKLNIPMQILPLVSMENPVFNVKDRAAGSLRYCVALLPMLRMEECAYVLQLLGKWLLLGVTGAPYDAGSSISADMAAQIPDNLANALDYETLDAFLNNNLQFNVRLDWERTPTPGELSLERAVIPMPPPVRQEQKYPDSDLNMNLTRYWKDIAVPGSYAQSITDYFQKLNADPNYTPNPQNNRLSSNSVPMAQIVFLDYIQILYSELVRKLKSQFDRYTFDSKNFLQVCAEENLELDQIIEILEKNPQLKLAKHMLHFKDLAYVVQKGDTLQSIQSKLQVSDTDMLAACKSRPGLIRGGANVNIPEVHVELAEATPWKMIAANIFVREHGESITTGYQPYITEILDANPNLTMEWIRRGADTPAVSLPGPDAALLWGPLYGDTVLLLAKMLKVVRLPEGKLPEWDSHWVAFAEHNHINRNQGMEYTSSFTTKDRKVTIPTDMSLSEMRLRYYLSNAFSESDPCWNQDILRPMTSLTLSNVWVELMSETTVNDVFSGKNLSADHIEIGPAKLAETLLNNQEILKHGQPVILHGLQHLSQGRFLQLCYETEFVESVFGMGSRFLLQGLRVPNPNPNVMERTIPLYKLMYQQLMASPNQDFVVALQAGQPDRHWVSFGEKGAVAEGRLSYSKLLEFAPDPNSSMEISRVTQMDDFREVECYYPAASEILLRTASQDQEKSIQMLSKALIGGIDHKMEQKREANLQAPGAQIDTTGLIPKAEFQNESIECGWGLLIPLEIAQGTAADVYQMYGASPADRRLLLELLQNLDSQAEPETLSFQLLYQPSPLLGLPESLTACSFSADSFLVKTNLSVETHRAPVYNRMIQPEDYQANLVEKDYQKLLWLLWECSTVGGGGYYLRLTHNGSSVLPENIFDENKRTKLWLLIERNQFIQPVNCALTLNTSRTKDKVLFHAPELTIYHPTLPVGCVGLQFSLNKLEGALSNQQKQMRDLFSIVGYRIEGMNGFLESNDSLPLLPAGSEEGEDYNVILPLYRFTEEQQEDALYSAIGKTAEIHFELRDILGNRAEINHWSAMANPKYNDMLIGLHEWPCCSWDYLVENKNLILRATVDRNAGVTQEGIDWLNRSRQQLQCPDVEVSIYNRVLGISRKNEKEVMIRFAKDLQAYMQNKLVGGAGQEVEDLTLRIESKTLPDSYLTEPRLLQTILHVERTGISDYEIPAGAKWVESVIRPRTEMNNGIQTSIETFVTKFEDSYQELRLALGDNTTDLYAVCFGDQGFITHVSIQTENKPNEIYAIAPLSNEWITRKVSVKNLDPNGILEKAAAERFFSDIDLEVWRDLFLSDVERVMECDIASVAAQLKTDGTEKTGEWLSQLIDGKKTLAEVLSLELKPILNPISKQGLEPVQENVPVAPSGVKKLVADRFKRSLTDPYLTLVAQYDCMLETHNGQWCRIVTENIQDSPEMNVQTSKLSNVPGENIFCIYAAAKSDSRTFQGKISLRLSEIEYDIVSITKDGYQSSRWLKLIHPIDLLSGVLPSGIASSNPFVLSWPNPLKRCPVKPALVSHKMLDPASPASVSDILYWNYEVVAKAKAYEQDTLHMKVMLNNQMNYPFEADFFNVFAQYFHIRDSLWRLLEENLSPDATVFANAFSTFVKQVINIKDAWVNKVNKKDEAFDSVPENKALKEVNSYHCTMQFSLGDVIDKEIAVQTRINNELSQAPLDNDSMPTAYYSDWTESFHVSQGQEVTVALRIPKLSLLNQHIATPMVWVERNQNLYDSQVYSVNPAFIYRTQEVRWPALIPSREYNEVFPLEKTVSIGSDMNMSGLVEVLRGQLPLDQQAFIVSLTAFYAYDLIKNNPLSAIRIPVCLITDPQNTSDSGESTDIFKMLTAALQDWCKAHSPAFVNASFYFDVRVRLKSGSLRGLGEGVQLLHLSKIRIDVQ